MAVPEAKNPANWVLLLHPCTNRRTSQEEKKTTKSKSRSCDQLKGREAKQDYDDLCCPAEFFLL